MSSGVPAGSAGGSRAGAFEFTDQHFAAIRELVTAATGVQLPDMKRQLAYSRFARRLRKLGMRSFDEYLAYLRDPATGELDALPSIITTNVTAFLREAHHFDYLREHCLPKLRGAARVRIWSSACATGEEPWTIAAVVMEVLGGARRRIDGDVKILATDIDAEALAHGRAGVYPRDRVPPAFAERWMLDAGAGKVEVRPELRRLVTFKRLNLLGPWPMKGPFDVIFCRNVVIYFDHATKAELFTRQSQLQRAGGLLMIGHSEQLSGPTGRYRRLGHTIYEKLP